MDGLLNNIKDLIEHENIGIDNKLDKLYNKMESMETVNAKLETKIEDVNTKV